MQVHFTSAPLDPSTELASSAVHKAVWQPNGFYYSRDAAGTVQFARSRIIGFSSIVRDVTNNLQVGGVMHGFTSEAVYARDKPGGSNSPGTLPIFQASEFTAPFRGQLNVTPDERELESHYQPLVNYALSGVEVNQNLMSPVPYWAPDADIFSGGTVQKLLPPLRQTVALGAAGPGYTFGPPWHAYTIATQEKSFSVTAHIVLEWELDTNDPSYVFAFKRPPFQAFNTCSMSELPRVARYRQAVMMSCLRQDNMLPMQARPPSVMQGLMTSHLAPHPANMMDPVSALANSAVKVPEGSVMPSPDTEVVYHTRATLANTNVATLTHQPTGNNKTSFGGQFKNWVTGIASGGLKALGSVAKEGLKDAGKALLAAFL